MASDGASGYRLARAARRHDVRSPTRRSTPAELARAAEERGFARCRCPSTPTSRRAGARRRRPATPSCAEEYKRTLDPFVALAMAAAVTERLRVGTGIALVAQRDPIVTAKAVATLDHLSGGRFVLGIGFGWNADELEDHGVAMKHAARRRPRARARDAARCGATTSRASTASTCTSRRRGRGRSRRSRRADRRARADRRGGRTEAVRATSPSTPTGGSRSAAPASARRSPDLRAATRSAGRDPATLRIVPFGTRPRRRQARALRVDRRDRGRPASALRRPDEVAAHPRPLRRPSSIADRCPTSRHRPGRAERISGSTIPSDPGSPTTSALNDPEHRRQVERRGGYFIVEGVIAIERLLANPRWSVRSLLLLDTLANRLAHQLRAGRRAGAGRAVQRAAIRGRLRPAPRRAGFGGTAERRPPAELIADARLLLVTEGVNDHENLGGLFRNAAAFNVDGMLFDSTTADPLYRRSVRVSIGHVLDVPFASIGSLPDGLAVVRDAGVTLVRVDPVGVGSRSAGERTAGHRVADRARWWALRARA